MNGSVRFVPEPEVGPVCLSADPEHKDPRIGQRRSQGFSRCHLAPEQLTISLALQTIFGAAMCREDCDGRRAAWSPLTSPIAPFRRLANGGSALGITTITGCNCW